MSIFNRQTIPLLRQNFQVHKKTQIPFNASDFEAHRNELSNCIGGEVSCLVSNLTGE